MQEFIDFPLNQREAAGHLLPQASQGTKGLGFASGVLQRLGGEGTEALDDLSVVGQSRVAAESQLVAFGEVIGEEEDAGGITLLERGLQWLAVVGHGAGNRAWQFLGFGKDPASLLMIAPERSLLRGVEIKISFQAEAKQPAVDLGVKGRKDDFADIMKQTGGIRMDEIRQIEHLGEVFGEKAAGKGVAPEVAEVKPGGYLVQFLDRSEGLGHEADAIQAEEHHGVHDVGDFALYAKEGGIDHPENFGVQAGVAANENAQFGQIGMLVSGGQLKALGDRLEDGDVSHAGNPLPDLSVIEGGDLSNPLPFGAGDRPGRSRLIGEGFIQDVFQGFQIVAPICFRGNHRWSIGEGWAGLFLHPHHFRRWDFLRRFRWFSALLSEDSQEKPPDWKAQQWAIAHGGLSVQLWPASSTRIFTGLLRIAGGPFSLRIVVSLSHLFKFHMIRLKIILIPLGLLGLFLLTGLVYFLGVHLPRKAADEAYQTGQAALQRGDLEAALAAFEETFRRMPAHPEAGWLLYDQVAPVDPDRGRAILAVLEDKGLSRQEVLARRIQEQLRAGDLEAARSLLPELEVEMPWAFEASYARLLLLFLEGRQEAVLKEFSDLINLYPEERKLQLLHGRVLLASDRLTNRVRGKRILLDLLDRGDFASLEASLLLSTQSETPLFENDMVTIGGHLQHHPFLEPGLARLGTPLIRGLALRYYASTPDLAFRLSQILEKRPDAGPKDRLLWLEMAQEQGNPDLVQSQVAALGAKDKPLPDELLILARQRFLEGDGMAALGYLERLLEAEPGSEGALRLLVRMLSADEGTYGDALRLALCQPVLDHPAADAQLVFNAAQLSIRLDPVSREKVLSRVFNRYSVEAPVPLGLWLLGVGEADLALDLVPPTQALSDAGSFVVRFTALLESAQFGPARELLEAAHGLLSPLQLRLAQARLSLAEGNAGEAKLALRTALETMGSAPEDKGNLFAMARLAGDLQDTVLRRQILDRAQAGGLVFPTALALDYLGQLLDDKDFEAAKRFTAYCRNLEPQNPVFINNDSYLQILEEKNLETCVEDMRALVDAHPRVPVFRITLALAELLGGYPEVAMASLEQDEQSLEFDDLRSKFIFVLVLAGNGKNSLARSMADSIDTAALMPIEVALLNRLLISGNF